MTQDNPCQWISIHPHGPSPSRCPAPRGLAPTVGHESSTVSSSGSYSVNLPTLSPTPTRSSAANRRPHSYTNSLDFSTPKAKTDRHGRRCGAPARRRSHLVPMALELCRDGLPLALRICRGGGIPRQSPCGWRLRARAGQPRAHGRGRARGGTRGAGRGLRRRAPAIHPALGTRRPATVGAPGRDRGTARLASGARLVPPIRRLVPRARHRTAPAAAPGVPAARCAVGSRARARNGRRRADGGGAGDGGPAGGS